METIKTKLEKLHSIHGINKGGCAFVAYNLVKWLNTHYPDEKAHVVYLLDAEDYCDMLDNKIISCSHAVVKFREKYYDTKGVHTLAELKTEWHFRHTPTLTQQQVLISLRRKDLWNPKFNRKAGLPAINRVLDLTTTLKRG